jgi:prepilin-type N-terminal cleavage/methylation domain-containing protein
MTNSGRRNLFDLHRPVIRSTFSIRDCSGSHAGRKTRAITGDTAAATGGFTLIEVLVVIAIIIILAGLILTTAGYVQKKGARARAETEIAAISAAIESYKADNAIYPRDTVNSTTDNLNAQTDFNPNATPSPNVYQNASQFLYGELSGDRNFDGTADTGSRSYLSLKVGSLLRNDMSNPPSSTNQVIAIRDPFGNSYGYSTIQAANPGDITKGYNPTFDLWTTAGGTTTNDVAGWIKNW